MRKISLACLGAVLVGTAFTPSLASAAEALTSANVRSEPVTGYVVDVLTPGEEVTVDRCNTQGWCYIIHSGPDGWVSARLLSADDGVTPPITDERDSGDTADYGDRWDDGTDSADRPRDNVDVGVSFGFGLPGFSVQIGNGSFDTLPLRSRTAKVCFYERSYFRGDSFCVRPGERLPRLGDWNDEISSIDVRGGARALVCERANFRGRCVVVSRDLSTLGRSGDNEISSIRVR